MRSFLIYKQRLFLVALFLVSVVSLGGTQVSVQTGGPRPLITQLIDNSQLVTLSGHLHPLATPQADQGEAPSSLVLARNILVLKRGAAQQAVLDRFLDDEQNPKSKNYHKWMKPSEYGQQFGVAAEDIQKITGWLTSYGFKIEDNIAGGNLIVFSGTHAQLKAAFHTALHQYKVNGTQFWANSTDPQIPAALAPVISGFASLNNYPRQPLHSHPQLIRHEGSAWKPVTPSGPRPQLTVNNGNGITYAIAPNDLAAIYNIKPLWDAGIDGTGQTIAIVGESDINPDDVDFFRSSFGLPPKKLNIIYYGPNPGLNGDPEGEAALDVQWAGAVAKNATIDLVVAAPTVTSGGIDGAAIYIINNNLASIMNVSWGACEYNLGTEGNLFYREIWQQAAAQGITVLVSTGDAGSAACDQNEPYASDGLAVSGIASTPFNVAVGGTDLYGTYTNPNAYWNSTNDPATQQSAKSYMPELPWNNSCGSPQLLAALQATGAPDATLEALCNDTSEQQYFLNTQGGSGGPSNCITVNSGAANECVNGYPKPNWQSGVTGIPSDGVRDIPDVSLMAGNGLWGSLYVYCQSDATSTGSCDLNTGLQGAGGTSFASPAFAGMVALLQQKTAMQQGNLNYVLYKLAATQYAGSNANSCTTTNAAANNACLFYDVTDGSIAVPCQTGTKDCTPATKTDSYSVLPGYDSGAGYDLATGIGTVNAYNLIQGWNSAASTFLSTSTIISKSGSTSVPYGTNLDVALAVTPSGSASGTPSGDVAITSNSPTPDNISIGVATLSNGQATFSSNLLPGGTYQLFARYAGDAMFAPSSSMGLSVTISPGNANPVATASRTSLIPGQKSIVSLLLTGPANGAMPTGTAVFTDTTTGAVLGTQALAATGNSSAPVASAYISLTTSQMKPGANTIQVAYSGDSNYGSAEVNAPVISVASQFTATLSSASITIAPNGTASDAIIVTPSGSTSLDPSQLTFFCPATMPSGITCAFSAPATGANGTVTSTLTLQLASPLFVKSHTVAATPVRSGKWSGAGAVGVFLAGLLFFWLPRKRRNLLSSLCIIAITIGASAFVVACGGSGGKSGGTTTPSFTPTSTVLSASPDSPVLNSPITFTAHVAPSTGTGTPTGNVTFASGNTTLSTVPLASGAATLTTSSLPVGSQTLTATYGGDSTFAASNTTKTVDVTFTTAITVTVVGAAGNTSNADLSITVQ